MTETDEPRAGGKRFELPILQERRWVIVTWVIIGALAVLTSILFTWLWIAGKEPAGAAGACVAATIVWIGAGLHERTLHLAGDLLGFGMRG